MSTNEEDVAASYLDSFDWPIRDKEYLNSILQRMEVDFGLHPGKSKVAVLQMQYLGRIAGATTVDELKIILGELVVYIFEPYNTAFDNTEDTKND